MKYTKQVLEDLVPNCKSMADVCRHFNVMPLTGSQTHLSRKIRNYGIDTSHFTGQGWRKGRTFVKKDASDYFITKSTESSHRLKLRLIRDGHKEAKCESCGLDKWQGYDLVLELDHIDSDHSNNELDNLQIVCPNCHAMLTRLRKNNAPVAQLD